MNQSSKSKFTISQKLWIFSGVLLAAITGIGAMSYSNTQALSHAIVDLAHTQIEAVRGVALIDMMHDGIRGVVYRAEFAVMTKNDSTKKEVLEEIKSHSDEITQHFEKLEKLDLSPEVKAAIQTASKDATDYAKSGVQLVNELVAGQTKDADKGLEVFEGNFEALEKSLGQLGDLVENGAKAISEKDIQDAKKFENLSLFSLFASILFGIGASYWIVRDLSKTLSAVMNTLSINAHQVNQTSSELDVSSTALSSATEQQAAGLQETAASLEEISSMVKKTSENSQALESSASKSLDSAAQGREAVESMLRSMNEIKDSNQEIMTEINNSNDRITEITQVISVIGAKTKVINDIVFQTKLLSFNASVEAARAGEHGKGFAVVAEEVGNLAVMSGNASKEISELLDTSLNRVKSIVDENKSKVEKIISEGSRKVEQGSMVANSCGEALGDIVTQTEEVSRMVKEITSAIGEQTNGITEISKAIAMIDTSTQETTTIASKTHTSSSELLSQARELNNAVQTLAELVGQHGEPSQEQTPTRQRTSNLREYQIEKSQNSKRAA